MPGLNRATVLVVDDDPDSRSALGRLLGADGYRVLLAEGGREALRMIVRERPDCVVLDFAMPGFTGLEVLRRLRQSEEQVPVLMLSAKSDPYDKVSGYSSGADIYVGKDEDPSVLRAAVQRLLQHREAQQSRVEAGGLVLDPETWTCTLDGVPVHLPRRQFHLLWTLASQPGRVLRKEQLVNQVWGVSSDVYNRAVDNAVVELRRLLGEDSSRPRFVHTVRGIGYKFEAAG
ncbi:MAG: response regulator transcription factor [Candidatus Dormibacteria bacterium]